MPATPQSASTIPEVALVMGLRHHEVVQGAAEAREIGQREAFQHVIEGVVRC
jgi:hypothetical protein